MTVTVGSAKLRILALILVLVIGAYAVFALLPAEASYEYENPMLKDGEMPILIAHRGGDEEFPGNTLEAFYNAYNVDERVIMETDACLTKDGVIILSHNDTLDEYTNVTGAVIDWNYSDLMAQRVDFGYDNPVDDNDALDGEREHFNVDGVDIYPTDAPLPDGVLPRDDEVFLATTLDELLSAFPNNRVSVEIKQSGEVGIRALNEVLKIIEEHDAFGRVIVASFHTEIFEEVKRLKKEGLAPDELMYSPPTMGMVKYIALSTLGLEYFYNDGVSILQIPMERYGINLATKGIIERAHSLNIAVHYWTINDEDEMRELIALGADGIMTDCPSKLKAVYDEMSSGN